MCNVIYKYYKNKDFNMDRETKCLTCGSEIHRAGEHIQVSEGKAHTECLI